VNKNCSSASLFYLRILERLAYQPIYAKYVSDSKEVAKAIYDSNFYMNHELDIFGHA
jgi:SEL1 protein